jgi:ribonuclease BN (tRNA processing enzyme)
MDASQDTSQHFTLFHFSLQSFSSSFITHTHIQHYADAEHFIWINNLSGERKENDTV